MSYEKELYRLDQPHGDGELYFAWQKGSGLYLATVGNDFSVNVYNRQGKLHERIKLPGQCTGFGWDSDGDLLGMICDGSFMILLWDSNTGKKHTIDTGLRETLTVIAWAKNESTVAIGSVRGNLCIYSHASSKRIPVLGKHSRRVVTAAWSVTGLLALGSEDKTFSVNNSSGDTLRSVQLRSEPSALQFAITTREGRPPETMVSVILGKKILFIYNLEDPDNPVELAFQAAYGNIVAYEWYGDSLILVGFSAGYFISISTKPPDLGQELYQAKNHGARLTYLALSHSLSKMATAGDTTVKIHELNSLSETTAVMGLGEEVDRVGWSEDGGLLCITTCSGSAVVFVSKLPRLVTVHGVLVVLLTSLSTVHIFLVQEFGKSVEQVLRTDIEPSVLGIGPYHVVLGMNNSTWVYDLAAADGPLKSSPSFLCDRQYPASVASLSLNTEYTSALAAGRIYLHLTEKSELENERESRTFPEPGEQMIITSHTLTTDFLIYSSDLGDITVFGLDDWTKLAVYKHDTSIKALYPDNTGTRVIVVDGKAEGYMYNSVDNSLRSIPDFPVSVRGVLWDQSESGKDIFIVFDAQTIYTFIDVRHSIDGSETRKLGSSKLSLEQTPILLQGDQVTVHSQSGKLVSVSVASNSTNVTLKPGNNVRNILHKQIAFKRYDEAWKTCVTLDTKDDWRSLAVAALKHLEIDFGMKVFGHIGDVAMVMSLEDISDIEDKKLLSGHIAELLADFDKAQELYLESSDPVSALTMRENLLQWGNALQLARSLAPSRVPLISLEYATQLELMGEHAEALLHYERGLTGDNSSSQEARCREGIARTCLRLGDLRRGLALALDQQASYSLRHQAAVILESIKKINEAALLYEKAENFDKAAAAYISLKNWKKVGELLPKVTDLRIYKQYAKVRESDGDYETAAEAYSRCSDVEGVVRLYLDKLNQPHRAVPIVEKTRNIHAAKALARYFEKNGDYPNALQFLVISRSENDALRLCKERGLVELYANMVAAEMGGSEEGERQLTSLGAHFEGVGDLMAAAKCYYHAAQFNKALRSLIQLARGNPSADEAVLLAVEVVAAANDDMMANQLIELLLGELDGEPRDPKFVFRLYRARKQYKEASKTAIIIANEELINGNYGVGHSVLVGMCSELTEVGLPISSELHSLLSLVHSYRLVRLHVRLGSHTLAARLLLRVADNISKFPSHIVPILTSAVIECHRADLKMSAFNYAAMLMKADYKNKIEGKYVKKLEGVVRKGRGSDPPEPVSPCPYCLQMIGDYRLVCGLCHSTLPFCITTGKHVLKEDFTVCPSCQFPAIRSEFIKLLQSGEKCPLCSSEVSLEEMRVHVTFESFFGKD